MPYLERSAHLGRVGSFPFVFRATSALGYANALSGRIPDALPLLDQRASQDLSETRALYDVARVYMRTSKGYLLIGRLDEATQMALRARDLAQQRREGGRLADVQRLIGDIAVHRDPPEVESAAAHYRQALVAAEELGMRPLQAHCHPGLGKLFHRIGDQAKATEHVTIAATMYREMDMGFWLQQAEAELGAPHKTSPRTGLSGYAVNLSVPTSRVGHPSTVPAAKENEFMRSYLSPSRCKRTSFLAGGRGRENMHDGRCVKVG